MTDFTRSDTDLILIFEVAFSEEQKLGELLYTTDLLREKLQARKYDDALLLSSTIAEKIISKVVTDNAFLQEVSIKQLDITLVDTILIKSIFTDIIELIAQDDVLLKDDRFNAVEKNFLAFLFVSEALVKEIEKTERDTLPLNEEQLMLLFKEVVDGLFLDSLTKLVKNRTATDNLFFKDNRFTEVALFLEDQVLLKELTLSIRSLLLGDTLFLVDETATLIIRAVVKALVYALLDALDFLGIEAFVNEDFLGTDAHNPFNVQFLQITLGARVASFFEHFENDFDG